MARRGKTKLGGTNTRAMLEAGKAQKGVTRAEERTGAFHERKGAVARQGAAAADKAIQYDVEQRKEGKRYDAQQAQRAEQTAFQQSMSERQQGLKEQEFKAGLADKGIQPTAPGAERADPGAGPKDPGAERAGAVEQEMEKGATQAPLMAGPTPDQQRMADQGAKPLEMPTGRGGFQGDYEFTEGRKKAEQQKRATTQLTQATAQMRAKTAFQKAFFQQDKETMEKAEAQLSAPIRGINAKLERFIEAAQDSRKKASIDWGGIKEAYGDNPDVAKAVENKDPAPVIRLLRNEMAYEGLKYFAATGKAPGDDLWDPTTQLGQQFTAEVAMQGMLAATLTGGYGVRTLAEKNRQLQQKAAQTMIYEMNMKQQEGPEEANKPLAPSYGGPAAQAGDPAPVHSQQHPGYVPREGPDGGRGQAVRGLSPAEQQRADQTGLTSEPAAPADKSRSLRSIRGGSK